VEEHSLYGVVAEEVGWVPAPGYVLRRARVLSALEHVPRGRLLEIGCGSGALLHDLIRLGFTCEAIETGPGARDVARYINRQTQDFALHEDGTEQWQARFDVVVALEVLEHIEDDRGALARWRDWLKPNGRLLLSVPAHQSRWGVDDEAVGHFRRYERADLTRLLDDVGFDIDHIESWGYPLANMIRPLRLLKYKLKLHRRGSTEDTGAQGGARAELSAESGVDRSFEGRLYPLQASRVGTLVMRLFLGVQSGFANTDLGNGYLLSARKR
jgi:SAM-dependent methyltransferase